MRRRQLALGVAVAALAIISLWNCRTTAPAAKEFTAEDVAAVRELLTELDPETYRIVLPVFTDGRVVDSATYGSLPVTEVRRLSSLQDVEYSESGNLQAIFQSCSGGGAGSHTESQTPGSDVGRRIERILAHIDESAYVFIR